MKKIVLAAVAVMCAVAHAAYEINGTDSLAVGNMAGKDASADRTVVIGTGAGAYMQGGDSNLFVGAAAGLRAVNVKSSVGMGHYAMRGSTNMTRCVAIGDLALAGRSGMSGATWINGQIYAEGGTFWIKPDMSTPDAEAPIYYNGGNLYLNAGNIYLREGASFLTSTNTVEIPNTSSATYDFYVSASSGNDFNDGLTMNKAFKTIDRACLAATNGQSIGILPGIYPYPEFFASNMLSASINNYDGMLSPYPLKLASLYGASTVIIDASLCADTNRAVIAGAEGATMTEFDGMTFKGCAYSFTPKKDRFLFVVFRNCVFDGLSSKQANNKSIWWDCELDSCRIRNSTFSAGIENADIPAWWMSVFGACEVSNCEIEFTYGEGMHQFSYCGKFRNCYISWNGVLTGWCSIFQNYNPVATFDCCSLVGEVSTNISNSARSNLRANFNGCLLGIDGLDYGTNAYHTASDCIVTNRATIAAAINDTTFRATEGNKSWRFYGYGSESDRELRNAVRDAVLDSLGLSQQTPQVE